MKECLSPASHSPSQGNRSTGSGQHTTTNKLHLTKSFHTDLRMDPNTGRRKNAGGAEACTL